MKAKVGDRLVVQGAHVSDHVREGVVLEVHGTDGAAPYLVRWADTGHETVVFPGPNTHVVPVDAEASG